MDLISIKIVNKKIERFIDMPETKFAITLIATRKA